MCFAKRKMRQAPRSFKENQVPGGNQQNYSFAMDGSPSDAFDLSRSAAPKARQSASWLSTLYTSLDFHGTTFA